MEHNSGRPQPADLVQKIDEFRVIPVYGLLLITPLRGSVIV